MLSHHITDNVIIAEEVIHSMNWKTCTTSYISIKVDLDKAYNRLKWDFIQETLIEVGLPT